MNIIVPEDDSIDTVIIDLRDVLNGEELQFVSEKNGIPEYMIYAKKTDFVKPGQAPTAENVMANLRDRSSHVFQEWFRDFLDKSEELIKIDPKGYRHRAIESLGVTETYPDMKIIPMRKGEKSIVVSAPLFRYSVQLIEVKVENTPSAGGQSYKVLGVEDGGMMPVEKLANVEEIVGKPYEEGCGVREMIQRTEFQDRLQEQDQGMER